MPLVGVDDIRKAAERLRGVTQLTSVEPSRALSDAAGTEVVLKCENLQRTGSFKIRGAYNRICQLDEAERQRGVVCASAGNHAQGVALAAQLLGVKATIFMPEGAALPKVEGTLSYGADVRLGGAVFDDTLAAAMKHSEEHGNVFVHPFDHVDVIAGQGTLGLELVDQVPNLGTVVVPIGGGGLISGVAAAVKGLRPDARVIGIQAAGAPSMVASLRAGEPVTLDAIDTIADGIATKRAGDLTLPHVVELVDEVATVDEASIARAIVLLLERAKLMVEPAGATGVAAILSGVIDLRPPVVAVLSGGNVDPLLLQHLVTTGLTAAGRYITLRTKVEDQPGELHRLLGLLAAQRANVVAVEHHRFGRRLRLQEVEIVVELETRGPDHIATIDAELSSKGYTVTFE